MSRERPGYRAVIWGEQRAGGTWRWWIKLIYDNEVYNKFCAFSWDSAISCALVWTRS